MIELTPEQRQAVEQRHGEPVWLVDSSTRDAYVLLRAEVYERLPGARPRPADVGADDIPEIAPGILRSMRAFWRDLPALLKNKRDRGKWVAYHGDERIGIAADDAKLIREARRRGFRRDAYHLDRIEPQELPPWEPEEIEPVGPWHFADPEDES